MRLRSAAPLLAVLLFTACMPATPGDGQGASSSSSSVASSDAAVILRDVSVKPGDTLKSGDTVTGEARGPFYFEASFPVTLTDDKGTVLAQVPAQAQGEWMTEDFVPFKATLTFTTSATSGTLQLKNDNPSGEPERDIIIEIPVKF